MIGSRKCDHSCSGEVDTFLLNHGQVKHLISIFSLSPNKRDFKKCTHNCTIALFPHVNKIILRIIQKQLETYIGYEMPIKKQD